MRHIFRIAILAAFMQLIVVAYPQSNNGTKGGMYDADPSGVQPRGVRADNLDPTNCGTPDDLKPCGPMPRRALTHYPAGR
jgi:hypothetical protein